MKRQAPSALLTLTPLAIRAMTAVTMRAHGVPERAVRRFETTGVVDGGWSVRALRRMLGRRP